MIKSLIKESNVAQVGYRWLKNVSVSLADNQHFTVASMMEGLLSKSSRDPRHISKQNIYSRLGRIVNQLDHRENSLNYPVFFINLDRDAARWQRFDKRAKRLGIPYIRVAAVDALSPSFDFKPYIHLIADTFWGGGTSIKKGTVGCYLSHMNVWKKLCDEKIDQAIVLEDDAYPLCPFPFSIDDFNLPSDYDIVHINFVTGAWLELDMVSPPDQDNLFLIYSHDDLIQKIYAQCGTLKPTGTVSYIISRKGAEKLLEIIYSSKICCGPDWAMVLHSMTPSFKERILDKIPEKDRKGISALEVSDIYLNSYVLMPSLADHRDYGESHIDHNNVAKRIDFSGIDLWRQKL